MRITSNPDSLTFSFKCGNGKFGECFECESYVSFCIWADFTGFATIVNCNDVCLKLNNNITNLQTCPETNKIKCVCDEYFVFIRKHLNSKGTISTKQVRMF